MKLKNLADAFFNAVFPERYTCEICGTELFDGTHLCDRCKRTVEYNDEFTCPVCGRKTALDFLCLECKAQPPKYKKAVSALVYREGAATLVQKFKNDNGYLKEYFAELLEEKVRQLDGTQAILYIPMTKKEKLRRGYNQSELLAKAIGRRLNLPVLDGAISKVKETEQQKTLTGKERKHNLAGAYRADKKLVKGKTLLVVDDVMTTGATADAATSSLLKAGAKRVYFAAVASVENKYDP